MSHDEVGMVVDLGMSANFLELDPDDADLIASILSEDSQPESHSNVPYVDSVGETRTMMQPIAYEVPRSLKQQLLQLGAFIFLVLTMMFTMATFTVASAYKLLGGMF